MIGKPTCWLSTASLIAILSISSSVAVPAFAQSEKVDPRLITFGPDARDSEGDHDFRQLVHVAVPEGAGSIFVRVFDADSAGTHDETQGGYNTKTKYSLYGDGAVAEVSRDDDGVVQETVSGDVLDSKEFGIDENANDQWTTVFEVDASKGNAIGNGMREFVVAVEGTTGNDGNVFEIAVSGSKTNNTAVKGAKLYSYLPTLQVPRVRKLVEMEFDIPKGAERLTFENFDAAGGRIKYAGQFKTKRLAASGRGNWKRQVVELDGSEAGTKGSVTAANGGETPNDITVFVGIDAKNRDAADQPIAINLPMRTFVPNQRPKIGFEARQSACGMYSFDATTSKDPEGSALRHIWRFGDANASTFDKVLEGAKISQGFEAGKDYKARLEVFDETGMVGSGSATNFTFFMKPRPVASFSAPELVAQGAEVSFDGTASSTLGRPEGNKIIGYHWKMGDGGEIVQELGDDNFGTPTYRFENYGTYEVELTVGDSADNPCNTHTIKKTITVNAPPVANAGGDQQIITGIPHLFDASRSNDPDGTISSYTWDFGDGSQASGPKITHTFHEKGDYEVKLTVKDDTAFSSGRGIDIITARVSDADNIRPVADAGADRTGFVGEQIIFDGTASKDEDGTIQSYAWDFGDGTGSDLPKVTHTYWEPGTYAVTLQVKDNNATERAGSVASIKVEIAQKENRAPIAEFPKEFATETFMPLRLDASKADDRDGTIIAYNWDFGDGTTGNGAVVEHMYPKPGIYNARLTLIDNGLPKPAEVSFDFKVIVAHKPNLEPKAESGPDLTGVAGQVVQFDGSASSDPDGSILFYDWDFGDGHKSTGMKTRHIYQFAGDYQVKLKVTDNAREESRLSATDTLKVAIAPPDGQTPVAKAGADMTVDKGEIVQFDGSASSDPDGNIRAFFWDFGDGGNSQKQKPKHAFHDIGTFNVKLKVTDDSDPALESEDSIVVTVVEKQAEGSSQ